MKIITLITSADIKVHFDNVHDLGLLRLDLIASRIPPGFSSGPVTELNVCNWRVWPWKHMFDDVSAWEKGGECQ